MGGGLCLGVALAGASLGCITTSSHLGKGVAGGLGSVALSGVGMLATDDAFAAAGGEAFTGGDDFPGGDNFKGGDDFTGGADDFTGGALLTGLSLLALDAGGNELSAPSFSALRLLAASLASLTFSLALSKRL